MSCTSNHVELLDFAQQDTLIRFARLSIEYGLENQSLMPIAKNNFDKRLMQKGASFVTLQIGQELRGCIGTVESYQPLIGDVVQHAYDAAFNDRRFPPLLKEEYSDVSVEVSVLSPKTPVDCQTEADLLQILVPNKHGLIIDDGLHKATFLPSVWEKLGDKALFLRHLKLKAGIAADYWSASIKAFTYEVIKIH